MLEAFAAWILQLHTILAGVVVVGISIGLSVLALAVFHLAVPHRIREAHNDVAGFTIAVVGPIYAVLLAFIAVAVWENFGRAEELIRREANLVGNLYRDTVGLPAQTAADLRHDLFVYAETVIQDEWPALAA